MAENQPAGAAQTAPQKSTRPTENANRRSTSRKLLALDRERKSVSLKLAGYSYEEIGAQLGITTMGAWKCVDRAMRKQQEIDAKAAGRLADIERVRLDTLQKSIWATALALTPDPSQPVPFDTQMSAMDRVLKIMDRRAKMDGHDKQSGTGDEQPVAGDSGLVGEVLREATKEELVALREIFQRIRERRVQPPAAESGASG